ncbi:SDR family NAD(P)-dependent oxidoreductase [Paraburkholderia sp. Ac-20340]|uniref:SDR family NAD(P)-dependent oxidoreductase n=1 Tax=Paraburkholderia sp. Ac-20340 TaxID=2703888 RepID=UPI001981186D|nr:SDR family NAD(P)-dependent oxidoreductase [Paraburkholderia sp. Ac-20340]MBN3853987.1 SDR family NAD(P)-dependent oxidoreductase [Paraburkholderia sp. Ac-20340]
MSQVWFITGASRGLGRAIANAALAEGHSVVATTRNGSFTDVGAEHRDRLLVMPLDVTAPELSAYTEVVDAAIARFGRIDVLVNNAGYGALTLFEESDEAQVRAAFETNVFGLMRVTRAVLPSMRRQMAGHLFNISSLAGYVGGGALYSATKFAVTGFTESLAVELSPFGIKVTNVAPGYFRTDFLDSSSVQFKTANELPDYETSRQARLGFLQQANHNQNGDPDALGRLLVHVASTNHPPLHLPVGMDAIDGIEQHQRALSTDIATWRDKSTATAHDSV